jgi:hypothetical protein
MHLTLRTLGVGGQFRPVDAGPSHHLLTDPRLPPTKASDEAMLHRDARPGNRLASMVRGGVKWGPQRASSMRSSGMFRLGGQGYKCLDAGPGASNSRASESLPRIPQSNRFEARGRSQLRRALVPPRVASQLFTCSSVPVWMSGVPSHGHQIGHLSPPALVNVLHGNDERRVLPVALDPSLS